MSNRRGHALWRTCLIGVYALREDIYLTGGNVLQDDITYRRACFIGGYVLQEEIFYGRTCLTRGHVLQDEISCKNQKSQQSGNAQSTSTQVTNQFINASNLKFGRLRHAFVRYNYTLLP